MKQKFLLLPLLFGILMTSLGLTLADEIECEYKDIWDRSTLKYGCEIKSIIRNSEGRNSFKGQHQSGKNDNDVKAVKYGESHWSTPNIRLQRFDSMICQTFPNLEELSFYYLFPSSIDENALLGCNSLEIFALGDAKIREIPELSLPTTLKGLNLRKNKLKTLPENFLKDLHGLEQLALSFNEINFLPPNIFESLTKLRYLDLGHNHLQSLNPVWFENLQNLEELNLALNGINELPRGVFVALKNLKELYLGGNELTVIHADSFGVHNKLKKVGLSVNKQLKEIDEKLIDILIASPAFTEIDAYVNECGGDFIEDKAELKRKFGKCISNYHPRVPSSAVP